MEVRVELSSEHGCGSVALALKKDPLIPYAFWHV